MKDRIIDEIEVEEIKPDYSDENHCIIECPECGSSLDTEILECIVLSEDIIYKCDICGTEFFVK